MSKDFRQTRDVIRHSVFLAILFVSITAGITTSESAFAGSSKSKISSDNSNIVKLRFSDDNSVCDKLENLFLSLHRSHPRATYLSEILTAFYNHTGVSAPPWIDHPDPQIDNFYADGSTAAGDVKQFVKQGGGNWSGSAFFRSDVAGDRIQRLALIRHDNLGIHGDYQTTIWFFRPGVSYRASDAQGFSMPQEPVLLEPNIVDLEVSFDKKLGDEPVSFPDSSTPDEDSKLLLYWFQGPFPQEPVALQGKVYIIAGAALEGTSVVYRINGKAKGEVVCLSAPDKALNEVKAIRSIRVDIQKGIK